MMGGGGALDAMNKTLKQNRALLKSKSGFERRKEAFYTSDIGKEWVFKKATPAQLRQINDKMVELRKSEMRRKAVILTFSIIVSLSLIWAALTLFDLYGHML